MNSRKIEIAPSIFSADFRQLEREVKTAQDCGADRIHCDVMDGHFVPNISFGPMIIEAVRKSVSIPLDVHLMISEPLKYIDQFCIAGADVLTVHAEACHELPEVLMRIKKHGVKTGVTVNPDKSVDLFLKYLPLIDQVLIMTVYAGFGGQKFISDMLQKIKNVSIEISRQKHIIDLQVDGGINDQTAVLCAQNGANVFVSGSYIFKATDYCIPIGAIRNAGQTHLKF
ncbi:MAG TPA: ribulose-phosphate 3-epimerase [Chitinispirillaceae bacterium]|nr:ribulose-phosphate 3-epimerase [Chitinispirillaceae bacterium]